MAYKFEDYGIKVTTEKEECIIKDDKEYCKVRLDVYIDNNEIIIELKTHGNKKGIDQLKNYMKLLNKKYGFLLQYVKGKVKVCMIYVKESVYYVYDGEVIYKHEE
jgi:GxxExxY protein